MLDAAVVLCLCVWTSKYVDFNPGTLSNRESRGDNIGAKHALTHAETAAAHDLPTIVVVNRRGLGVTPSNVPVTTVVAAVETICSATTPAMDRFVTYGNLSDEWIENDRLMELIGRVDAEVKKTLALTKFNKLTKRDIANNGVSGIAVSQTASWNIGYEVYLRDHNFLHVVDKITSEFNVEYAVDELFHELVTGIFRTGSAKDLGRFLSRERVTNAFKMRSKRLFKNFLIWVSVVGIVPVAYVDQDVPEHALHTEDLLQTAHAAKEWLGWASEKLRDRIAAIDESNWFRTFSEMVVEIVNVPAFIKERMVLELKAFANEPADRCVVMAKVILNMLFFQYNAPFLYIPDFDHDNMELVVIPFLNAAFVMDRHYRFYTCEITDGFVLTDGAPSSTVTRRYRDYCYMKDIREIYTDASKNNAQRSVVTAPPDEDTSVSKNTISDLLDRPEYNARQLFDILDSNNSTGDQLRLADGKLAGVLPSGISGGPGNLLTKDLNAYINKMQTEFDQKRFEHYKNSIDSLVSNKRMYDTLTDILNAISMGNSDLVMELLPRLSPTDLALLRRFSKLGFLDADSKVPGVSVLKLNAPSKLLCSFPASVSLPDLEELNHLWILLWESVFCSDAVYTRRRHTMQYNKITNKNEPRLLQTLQELFISMFNKGGVFFTKIFPTTSNKLTFTETMLLLNTLESPAIEDLIAGQLGLCPTDIVVKPNALQPSSTPGLTQYTVPKRLTSEHVSVGSKHKA